MEVQKRLTDLEKPKSLLEGYKVYFPVHWDNEKCRWDKCSLKNL